MSRVWTRFPLSYRNLPCSQKMWDSVCYYSVFLSKVATFCINSVSFLFLLLIDVHVLHLNYIIISLDDNVAKKIVKCVLFLCETIVLK